MPAPPLISLEREGWAGFFLKVFNMFMHFCNFEDGYSARWEYDISHFTNILGVKDFPQDGSECGVAIVLAKLKYFC